MKDLLLVNLCKTYKDNCSKEYLQNITTGDWRLNKNKADNVKYIAGIFKKQIICAYTIVKEPIYISNKKRFRFCDVKENNELLTKLKSKYYNNIKMYAPIIYLNSYDL